MTDPVTLGVIITVALIAAVVGVLLFTGAPARRRPAKGDAEAFHRLLLGHRDEARQLMTELVRAGDATPQVYLRLGVLLREEGQLKRSLALHQGLLARDGLEDDVRRLTELAVAEDLLAMGRSEDAASRLSELDKHLIDEDVLAMHAVALHRLGRLDDAADVLLRRAKLGKQREDLEAARYLVEIGREALRNGQPDTAARRARQARKLAEWTASYVVEGDSLLQRGDVGKAMDVWREGLRHAGDNRATLLPRLVEGAFQTGKLESLVEELETMRDEHPDDPALWKAVADLRLRRGDIEPFFVLIEDPPHPGAADLAAWAGWLRHLSVGDPAHLRRLLGEMPDSFGPTQWVCSSCHETDAEPRLACMNCGALADLNAVPALTPARRRIASGSSM